MLKYGLTLCIMNGTDHFLKEKDKKFVVVMKTELVGNFIKEVFGLRAKTYSYLKMTVVNIKKTQENKLGTENVNLKIIKAL